MADVGGAADGGWLVLIYRVPSEPSRLRSAVWRRLKSLGAIYLQNSAAALPASPSAERALRKLRSQILEMEGTAALLACQVLAGDAEVRAAFQAARDDEYEEIVDRCEDFLAQVRKEYVANHFTYAELEENEVNLVKLRNWFARVRQRDAFSADGRPRRRRRWRPASSRSTTTPPGCTRPTKRATEPLAPGVPGACAPPATAHLLDFRGAGRCGAATRPAIRPLTPAPVNPVRITLVRS